MSYSDCIVTDLSLAAWGRKEIQIAEVEMPGLMAIRKEIRCCSASKGGQNRWLHSHDDSNCCFDRNTDCFRC